MALNKLGSNLTIKLMKVQNEKYLLIQSDALAPIGAPIDSVVYSEHALLMRCDIKLQSYYQ